MVSYILSLPVAVSPAAHHVAYNHHFMKLPMQSFTSTVFLFSLSIFTCSQVGVNDISYTDHARLADAYTSTCMYMYMGMYMYMYNFESLMFTYC